MTTILSILAVLVALGALGLAVAALRRSAKTSGELARHRYSHTLGDEDRPARRHGHVTGPEPRVDEHAAPPTSELRAQRFAEDEARWPTSGQAPTSEQRTAPPPPPGAGDPTTMLPLPGRIGRERGPQ